VVLVAADHGIAAAGVSAQPAGATRDQVAAARERTTPGTVLAQVGEASVRIVDAGIDAPDNGGSADRRIRRGSGRIDREDALTADEARRAVHLGRALADEEVDAGTDLLVPGALGVGATTPASVLVAALTGAEPVAVVGRGGGLDDAGWMRKAAAVRDALRRARRHSRDPLALLRVAGGADLGVLAGLLAQAAVRRTPVLLDGLVVGAAALLADELAPGARAWWRYAQHSTEPAMALAAERLELVPLVDLGLRIGDGSGAVAVLPLLRMAARLLTDTATTPIAPAAPTAPTAPTD
jgi:nicotinate-nucleotide--dimethylbenzimidazole phosphoribosyltransferase